MPLIIHQSRKSPSAYCLKTTLAYARLNKAEKYNGFPLQGVLDHFNSNLKRYRPVMQFYSAQGTFLHFFWCCEIGRASCRARVWMLVVARRVEEKKTGYGDGSCL